MENLPGGLVDPGIEWERQLPWIVSRYEEDLVRIEARYTKPLWAALPLGDRAAEIAHYRLRQRVRLFQQEAVNQASKRK